jgi:hypothetical protein
MRIKILGMTPSEKMGILNGVIKDPQRSLTALVTDGETVTPYPLAETRNQFLATTNEAERLKILNEYFANFSAAQEIMIWANSKNRATNESSMRVKAQFYRPLDVDDATHIINAQGSHKDRVIVVERQKGNKSKVIKTTYFSSAFANDEKQRLAILKSLTARNIRRILLKGPNLDK